jgi:hypothetical protein
MKVYHEYLGVEQALKRQIVAAVEPRWLQALHNHISNSITMPVIEINNYLYRMYGKISTQMLTDKESSVKTMVWDVLQPIDDVFDTIQQLIDLAATAMVPYTPPQIVNIAYNIINNTRKFSTYVV